MSKVLYRATKYMNVEDTLLDRKEKPKKRERQEELQKDQGGRRQRQETEGMKGALNLQEEDSQASPHSLPR